MLEVRARDVKIAAADVVDGFVVNEESAIRVFDCAMGREYGIVRLDDRSRDKRRWVDGKFELALLAVVGGEAFEEERAKA